MTASHIYFALRPEKLWITWSMVRGWIDKEHYVEHFDPEKWVVSELPKSAAASGAATDASVSAPREDQA
jgi:hypothetical protein